MRIVLSLLLLFLTASAPARQARLADGTVLRTGDLLFQDLDCGPLCDAIEEVTQSYGGQHFSHTGLVYLEGDSAWVIEAAGSQVRRTPLSSFLARSTHKVFAARLKPAYQKLIAPAVDFSLRQLGTPYDEVYLYNNGKYYCSELIYDAFKEANGGQPFFRLEPMTFRPLQSKEFFPAWVDYYRELGTEIPEGALGINPGGLSRSEKIRILNP